MDTKNVRLFALAAGRRLGMKFLKDNSQRPIRFEIGQDALPSEGQVSLSRGFKLRKFGARYGRSQSK